MTQPEMRNVYVLAQRPSLAEHFWAINGDRTSRMVRLSATWPTATVPDGITVWVLGFVDYLMAETVSYLVEVHKVRLKYAESDEKVVGLHG